MPFLLRLAFRGRKGIFEQQYPGEPFTKSPQELLLCPFQYKNELIGERYR